MKTLVAFLSLALAIPAIAVAANPEFPDISHDELVQAVEQNQVTVIDVNGTKRYKAGHIPGAINFEAEKDNLAAKLPEDKDALIVAYCGSPKCGAYKRAAKAAKELGYTNVKHYSPGIAGWTEVGAPTETDAS